MRINHNISAIKANSILGRNENALEKSLERLSSGLRINRAADDAAGMAISQKMKTQIAGLDQASRNAADGISVIQTAEGALSEVQAMLQRMRELSVQAANGTNTLEDRKAIQEEITNLNAEIQRISDTTEFNTKTLLNGNIDRKSYSSENNIKLISLSDAVGVKDYEITVTQDARQAVIVGNTVTMTATETITAADAGTISINGQEIEIEVGDTLETIYKKLRDLGDSLNVAVFGSDTTKLSPDDINYSSERAGYNATSVLTNNSLVFVSEEYGSDQTLEIRCEKPGLAAKLGLTMGGAKATGVDAKAVCGNNFSPTATVSAKGNVITVTDRGGFEMKYEINDGTAKTAFFDSEITNSTDASTIAGMVVITKVSEQAVINGTSVTMSATDKIAAGQAGTITINGETVTIAVDDTLEDIINKLTALEGTLTGDDAIKVEFKDNMFKISSVEYGDDIEIDFECDNPALAALLGVPEDVNVKGVEGEADYSDGYILKPGESITVDGDTITIVNADGTFVISDKGTKATISVLKAGPMELQIGANEGQTMVVTIPEVTPKTLGIDKINLSTEEGAQEAITAVSKAVDTVSAIRAKLGAYQNRLEHSIANLDVGSENMTEALSRIEDVDMAEEMANYTQLQVLTQAGTAMLAQANERPQNVLTLLQG